YDTATNTFQSLKQSELSPIVAAVCLKPHRRKHKPVL
ncbi:hypothetical protein KIPB_013980, partial [Kipferlia bialata]